MLYSCVILILEIDKSHKSLSKVMRGVASTEPNQKLQNVYFLYSQKQELLEKERNSYRVCEKQTHEVIDESKNMLITPLRVSCSYCRYFIWVSNVLQEIIADHKTLRKKTAGKSTDELNDTQFIQSTLPLHMKMFEKHRVDSMKKLMSTLLLKEIQYHSRALEELSVVLQSLHQIQDDE